jgi:osmotically-inducible protein OsmY
MHEENSRKEITTMRMFTGTTIGMAAVLFASAPAFTPAQAAQETTEQMPNGKGKVQEVKEQITDAWLTAKAKIALFGDERVRARRVTVETNNGEVTLRGKVDSEKAKVAAEEDARDVEHVINVRNELQIVRPSERATVDTDDKAIAQMVDQRLRSDPRLRTAKIKARVDAGIVTLTGETDNLGLSSYASETLSDVPGVRAVRNDLTYQSNNTAMLPPPSGGVAP